MEELGALLFSVGDDDLFSASLDILRAPQSETTPEERLQALTELEDLVHSIDFGVLLVEGDDLISYASYLGTSPSNFSQFYLR